MWISRKRWLLIQTDVMAIRGEVEEISKVLGVPFFNRIKGKQEEPEANELCVVLGLLKQAARLLEEANSQGKKS